MLQAGDSARTGWWPAESEGEEEGGQASSAASEASLDTSDWGICCAKQPRFEKNKWVCMLCAGLHCCFTCPKCHDTSCNTICVELEGYPEGRGIKDELLGCATL